MVMELEQQLLLVVHWDQATWPSGYQVISPSGYLATKLSGHLPINNQQHLHLLQQLVFTFSPQQSYLSSEVNHSYQHMQELLLLLLQLSALLGQDIHMLCNMWFLHHLHSSLHHPIHTHNCYFHHHTSCHLSIERNHMYQDNQMGVKEQQWMVQKQQVLAILLHKHSQFQL